MESIDVNSATGSNIDDELLRQIDVVLETIEEISLSKISEADFFSQLLEHAVLPFETLGAGIWKMGPNDHLVMASERSVQSLFTDNALWQAERERLACSNQTQVGRFTAGEKRVLSFSSRFGGSSTGIIAFYVPDDLPESALTGYLEYTQAIADLIEQFFHRSDHREIRTLLSNWERYETTSLAIQRASGRKEIAFQVTNEGRYFLDVDRLTLATRQKQHFRIAAISGVDSINATAELPKRLERLIDAVAKTDETFVFRTGQADTPPQVESPLCEYQELAAANSMIVVPIKTDKSQSMPNAALVVEQFKSPWPRNLLARLDRLSKQVGIAIGREQALSEIPFYRLGMLLRPVGRMFAQRHLSKWGFFAVLSLGFALSLFLIQTDFEIRVRGELRPQVEKTIYASNTGIVSSIEIDQGEKVTQGEALIVLESNDLELEYARIIGELATARQQLAAIDARRLQVKTGDRQLQQQETQLSGDAQAAKKRIDNLSEQLQLVKRQQAALTIASPITGQVLTWDPQNVFANRPVQKGQKLLQVADLEGAWVLQFDVPDHRIGHVLKATSQSQQALPVRFLLANNPHSELTGSIRRIENSTQQNENGQSIVLAEAEFDHELVRDLRPGLSVSGKIHCGRSSLGYVWFHEFFEEIQRRFF